MGRQIGVGGPEGGVELQLQHGLAAEAGAARRDAQVQDRQARALQRPRRRLRQQLLRLFHFREPLLLQQRELARCEGRGRACHGGGAWRGGGCGGEVEVGWEEEDGGNRSN